jgi:hypothetical protein
LIIQDAFEDVALLIGGAASLHQLENQLVRTLMRRLDHVRTRALARLEQVDASASRPANSGRPYHLHPAIEGFLRRQHGGHQPGLSEMPSPEDRSAQPSAAKGETR